MIQISQKIVRIFDADAEADQPVCDAKRLALIGIDRGMGHDGGMFDQGFNTAERFRQGKQSQGLKKDP